MWSDLVAWLGSEAGTRVIDGAVVPAVAILFAALLAAWIGRRALAHAAARLDRSATAHAVASAVASADAAAAQSGGRRSRAQRIESDVRLRMLPLPGAVLAAEWVEQTMAGLERGDADAASPAVVRDRLLAWTVHPRRAAALFAAPRTPRAAATESKSASSNTSPAKPPQPAPSAEQARPERASEQAAPAPEPESGPLTQPVVLVREPDPMLLAAVERELAGASEGHARHARPTEPAFATPAPPASERPTPQAAGEDAASQVDDDDSAEVIADATEDAPDPVLVSTLGDRRFAPETLVPEGANPGPRGTHRSR